MPDSINNSPRVPNGSGTDLPFVGAGDAVRPAMFNRLAEGIDRSTIQPGKGLRVTKTSSSTIVSSPDIFEKAHPFKAFRLATNGTAYLTIKIGNFFGGTAGVVNEWRANNTVVDGGDVAYTTSGYKEGYHGQGAEIMFDVADANYISSKHYLNNKPLLMPLLEGLYYIELAAWSGRQLVAGNDVTMNAKISEWNTYSTAMKGVIRPIIKYATKEQMEDVLPRMGVIPICNVDKYGRLFQVLASDIFYRGERVRPGTVNTFTKEGTRQFVAYPFTVNRVVPKVGDKYLDQNPPPSITITGEGYVAVKCTYVNDKFFPRTAELVFVPGATMAGKEDTETESYFPIAKINVTGTGTNASYSVVQLSSSNLIVNRLKAGGNYASWWWDEIG